MFEKSNTYILIDVVQLKFMIICYRDLKLN